MGAPGKHRPLYPVIVWGGIFLVALILWIVTASQYVSDHSGGAALASVWWFLVGSGTLIGLLVAIANARYTYRNRRPEVQRMNILRAGGPDSSPQVCAQQIRIAQDLYARALSDRELPTIQSASLPMRPGEAIYACGRVEYARFYGQDVQFQTSSTFAFGSPAFVAGAMIGSAIQNSRVRKQAYEASIARWREIQFVDMWLTNERIIVNVGGRWLEFWLGGVVAVFPDPANFSMVLQFGDTEALRLTGPVMAGTSVLAHNFIIGKHGLAQHPAFQVLRGSGSAGHAFEQLI